MRQKGLAPILIVLLIALVLGGYFLYQNQNTTKQIPSKQTVQSSPSDETSNWKTYTNSDLTLRYPLDWTIVKFSGLDFISEIPFTPGQQDRSKIYNSFEILKYPNTLYSGYTNSEWFKKINNLKINETVSDGKDSRMRIASGKVASGQEYVIFKAEPSPTAVTDIVHQVKVYILKGETIYQITLDLYNEKGLTNFKNIIPTVEIK